LTFSTSIYLTFNCKYR